MLQKFSELYNANYDRFVRFAYRYVHDLAVAEDITSDAIIYFWENRSRLPEDTNIPAYILTSIKNQCLSFLRHQRVHENVASNILSDIEWEEANRIARLEAFEPSEVFTDEIQKLVDKALESLPQQTRQIFIMSRYEYLSHKEIAGKLNLSTKSVEFHISKAIRTLKEELHDYFPFVIISLFLMK